MGAGEKNRDFSSSKEEGMIGYLFSCEAGSGEERIKDFFDRIRHPVFIFG